LLRTANIKCNILPFLRNNTTSYQYEKRHRKYELVQCTVTDTKIDMQEKDKKYYILLKGKCQPREGLHKKYEGFSNSFEFLENYNMGSIDSPYNQQRYSAVNDTKNTGNIDSPLVIIFTIFESKIDLVY
jgi:hypothetical protein